MIFFSSKKIGFLTTYFGQEGSNFKNEYLKKKLKLLSKYVKWYVKINKFWMLS